MTTTSSPRRSQRYLPRSQKGGAVRGPLAPEGKPACPGASSVRAHPLDAQPPRKFEGVGIDTNLHDIWLKPDRNTALSLPSRLWYGLATNRAFSRCRQRWCSSPRGEDVLWVLLVVRGRSAFADAARRRAPRGQRLHGVGSPASSPNEGLVNRCNGERWCRHSPPRGCEGGVESLLARAPRARRSSRKGVAVVQVPVSAPSTEVAPAGLRSRRWRCGWIRARRGEHRPDLAQVVIDDRLARAVARCAIGSRTRCPVIAASTPSNRWISALNGSSFERTDSSPQ